MKMHFALLPLLFFIVINLPIAYTSSITALFSPEDKLTKQLLEHINGAKKSIHAAVYFLTDKVIAQALIDAKQQRNVDVKIILDTMSTDPKYGKADFLVEQNIDTFIFNPKSNNTKTVSNDRWGFNGPIMHHKFVVIDGILLWTGSFNWTVSANTQNCENVIITKSRNICKQYEEYFATLLISRCEKHQIAGKNKTLSSFRQSILTALESSDDDATLLEKLALMVQGAIQNIPPS